jgi:uncharacterized membrane-anchored protein YitT (DUF2179 family)
MNSESPAKSEIKRSRKGWTAVLAILTIGLASYLAQQLGPWWAFAISTFVIGFFLKMGNVRSFALGFLGIFFAWIIQAWIIDIQNDTILSSRIGGLLGGLPAAAVLIAGAVLGGIVGGLAAWSGSLTSRAMRGS